MFRSPVIGFTQRFVVLIAVSSKIFGKTAFMGSDICAGLKNGTGKIVKKLLHSTLVRKRKTDKHM